MHQFAQLFFVELALALHTVLLQSYCTGACVYFAVHDTVEVPSRAVRAWSCSLHALQSAVTIAVALLQQFSALP